MQKRDIIILIIFLILLFISSTAVSFYLIPINDLYSNTNISDKNIVVLGSNEYGKVTVQGPYGNKNSSVKVAYIVGVHPLESNAHKAIIESLQKKDKSLKNCHYIYKVEVTKDADDYEKGRMNGQVLASKFAVPHIISHDYNLAIDIHSNRGNYKEKGFVFTPVENSASKSFALYIEDKNKFLVYYDPPSQTSPQYVTIPLIKAGIPAIVYETYLYESEEVTEENALEFINTVDGYKRQ